MKKRIFVGLLLVPCAIWLAGAAFVQTMPISKIEPARVSVEADTRKLKRGRTYDFQVRVDLTGINAPGTTQAAAIGSYIIPITFDRNVLEFVSASGGESPAFASGPISATNSQTANALGMVTLVGAETTSDFVTASAGVAIVQFRVIASEGGRTSLDINPELASPGLSLASPAESTATTEIYRIAAMGESSSYKIK